MLLLYINYNYNLHWYIEDVKGKIIFKLVNFEDVLFRIYIGGIIAECSPII